MGIAAFFDSADNSDGDFHTAGDFVLIRPVRFSRLTIGRGHTLFTNGYPLFAETLAIEQSPWLLEVLRKLRVLRFRLRSKWNAGAISNSGREEF